MADDYAGRHGIIDEIRRLTGRVLDAATIRKRRFGRQRYPLHPLIRGIYKPAGETIVATILIALDSPYRDEVVRQGKSWCAVYHKQAGSPGQWDNKAMAASVGHDVGVLQQVSSRPKAAYLVLGVGRLAAFDSRNSLALITSPSVQLASAGTGS